MLYFRQLRKHLRLTQRQMAEACGVARTTWQMIEYGVFLPSVPVAARICELSGLNSVPCVSDCLTVDELRSWARSRPYELKAVNQEVWSRVLERCVHMTEFIRRIPAATLAWMEQMLHCDSVLEGFTWLQLAYFGARPMLGSPHQVGFRNLPVVDGEGKVLGERLLPGLQGEYQGLRYLLWPQVGLRPSSATFRVDGLMLLDNGVRNHWSSLEIDGPFHYLVSDKVRKDLLRLDEIRIQEAEVEGMRAVERIFDRAKVFFKKTA